MKKAKIETEVEEKVGEKRVETGVIESEKGTAKEQLAEIQTKKSFSKVAAERLGSFRRGENRSTNRIIGGQKYLETK